MYQKKVEQERAPQEKRGYLLKESPSIWISWQQRYIMLKEKKLKYYKSLSAEDMKSPQGVINFDNFACFVENVDSDKTGQTFAIGFMGN